MQILPAMGAFHESKEKKIGIICGMITPKTYLHTPHSVLKNAETLIDQKGVELVERLE